MNAVTCSPLRLRSTLYRALHLDIQDALIAETPVKLSITIFLPTNHMTEKEPITSLRLWKFTTEEDKQKICGY